MKERYIPLILILLLAIIGGILFNINVSLFDFTSRLGGFTISISSLFLGIWAERNWYKIGNKRGKV